jgi:succinoglycan biosynthesis transport protein ExoP
MHPMVDGSTMSGTATAGPTGGTLTVRDADLASLQPPILPPALSPGDPLAGGVDFMRIWHAFRRRWLPAVLLGVVLATAAAIPTWLFLPRGYEAVAWLQVSSTSVMLAGSSRDGGDYDSYRKTQVQLIKSPFVFTAALRRPGIAGLATLREESDPLGWLSRHIQVTAPAETEVIQVRLRGESATDAAKIVNAVTTSYLEDRANKERTDRLGRRDAFEKKYKENVSELRTLRDEFNTLARTLGTRDSSQVVTQRSLLLDHLGTIRAQALQAQRDIAAIDAELAVIDAKMNGELSADASVPEELVTAALYQDPQVVELSGRLAALDESIAYQQQRSARGANEPAVKRMRAQRVELVRQVEKRMTELRPQIIAQMAVQGASRRQQGQPPETPALLRMRRDMLSRSLAETTKELDKVSKEVIDLGQANADLEARKAKIDQLDQVTRQMGLELETSALNLQAPSRVTLLEEAGVPEGNDRLFRTMVAVLAGLAGFAVGGGAVVLVEYLRDRLSTSDEVPHRLGVRMLGTLPRVSRSRHRGNAGLMAECVDGVRTQIMQAGREAPKVILVTSAVEHEGKTTFAAQLAASIARADKRTLIIDGDLRHPNTHVAVELDLGAGLPELLRGELTPDEAVRPTTIEGLFAVTGGSCDYSAITRLSRPEMGRLIRHYRESFDHIIIDAGPVLAFSDTLLLGQQSDVAIVATMRDVSRVPLVNAAIERLRSVGVRVIGTVVNGVADESSRRLYASPLPA